MREKRGMRLREKMTGSTRLSSLNFFPWFPSLGISWAIEQRGYMWGPEGWLPWTGKVHVPHLPFIICEAEIIIGLPMRLFYKVRNAIHLKQVTRVFCATHLLPCLCAPHTPARWVVLLSFSYLKNLAAQNLSLQWAIWHVPPHPPPSPWKLLLWK